MRVHRKEINIPVFFLHHIIPHLCEHKNDKNFVTESDTGVCTGV